jgi:hypothetical protein
MRPFTVRVEPDTSFWKTAVIVTMTAKADDGKIHNQRIMLDASTLNDILADPSVLGSVVAEMHADLMTAVGGEPPLPQAPNPLHASDPAPRYTLVGTALPACSICGGTVDPAQQRAHTEWHERVAFWRSL